MENIKCKTCSVEFIRNYKERKFCSKICANIYTNKHRKRTEWNEQQRQNLSNARKLYYKNNPKNKRIIACKQCGKDFHQLKLNRKFCGVECSLLGLNRRQKGFISTRTLPKILRRAFPNWKYPFCDWFQTFNVHHITARSKGGPDKLDNLVMLCPNHHSIADLGLISNEVLLENTISKFFTEKELLENFYYNKNKKINQNLFYSKRLYTRSVYANRKRGK